MRRTLDIFGSPIDILSWDDAISRVHGWALARESRVVCICNVHSVVTALDDKELGLAIAKSDMSTPDGAPIAWLMRRYGAAGQKRINGPDFMWKYCEGASAQSSIFLYGSTPKTVSILTEKLSESFPGINIAGSYCPPFRALSTSEDDEVVSMINNSGASVVWVGLGCPKQEKWMLSHRGKINAVMIGVGAAFDYHAGSIKRAPLWMQESGLEWFYRLLSEPRRLWKRYFSTNSRFIFLVVRKLAGISN